jgi:hypothetical protein
MNSYNSPTTKPLYKGTQFVWYILWIVEALLGVRFLLKLLGANPAAEFTRIIYSLSEIFVSPFYAVFPRSSVAGSIFEWTTLLAMLVYWLIALAVVRLFLMGRSVSTAEAAERLKEEESEHEHAHHRDEHNHV